MISSTEIEYYFANKSIGLTVLNKLVSNGQNSINMAAYNKGIYIVRVIIDNSTYNYQVIKH